MYKLRSILALAFVALLVPFALRHFVLAIILAAIAGGLFANPVSTLRECRLGTNTLSFTGLTELLFQARDTVARELTGALAAVTINSGSEGVSLGGTVTSLRTTTPTLNTTYTPAMTIPAGDDQTHGVETMTIGQVANVRIPLTGEMAQQLINTIGFEAAMKQLLTQGIRVMVNAVESHVNTVAYQGASRAVGTAGTTPFGTNHNILADLRQILVDNGMTEPEKDGMTSVVMNTLAGTKLRQLSNLYKVSEAGSEDLLRKGSLPNLYGMQLRESAGIATHTKGAGTGYDIVSGGEAIGQTVLSFEGGTVNVTGIKAGDVLALDTDTGNLYVVRAGSVSTSGDLVIGHPGLRVAAVDASEITIGNSYTANWAAHKTAIELAMRPPALPMKLTAGGRGDAAPDRITLLDDQSGLVFEAAAYLGYGMNMVDLTTFYQAKAWKSEFIAVLRG